MKIVLAALLVAVPALADPLDAYTRTDIGRWDDVLLAPDGSSLALVHSAYPLAIHIRDRATPTTDRIVAKQPTITDRFTFARSYNGKHVTLADSRGAYIIDAKTATLVTVPCPAGSTSGAGTTATQLAIVCSEGVNVWSLASTPPKQIGTGRFGVDTLRGDGGRIALTTNGSIVDDDRAGLVVTSPTGLTRRVRAAEHGWDCNAKTCIDRFARILPDGKTYLIVRGSDSGPEVHAGDVIDFPPPKRVVLELRELATGKVLHKTPVPANLASVYVAGNTVAVTFGTSARFLDLPSLRRRADATKLPYAYSVSANVLSPDGKRFALPGRDTGIELVETATGVQQHIECKATLGLEPRFLGGLLVVTISRGASDCVGAYDLTGATPVKLAGEELAFFAATPDLRTLVATDRKTWFVLTR